MCPARGKQPGAGQNRPEVQNVLGDVLNFEGDVNNVLGDVLNFEGDVINVCGDVLNL
jgi:hypothetical protein